MDTVKIQRFKKVELDVLQEYLLIMSPIAKALDKLQGENECYLGLLMPTVLQLKKKLSSTTTTLNHGAAVIVDALISSLERRFPDIFEFDNAAQVLAAAAVCHPNFKLRWVPSDKKDWARSAFMEEAKKWAPKISDSTATPAQNAADDFFEFCDTVGQEDDADKVTIECLRFLDEPCSASLNCLLQFPSVKHLFRYLNEAVYTVFSSGGKTFLKGCLDLTASAQPPQ